jgi:hypothetical protein
MLPLRAVLLLESFREQQPIISEPQPRSFIESVPRGRRIQAAVFRSFATFLSARFFHIDGIRSPV